MKNGQKRNAFDSLIGHCKHVMKGFAARQTTNPSPPYFRSAEKREGYLYGGNHA